MKHQTFDERMRKQALNENFSASADAVRHFRHAMHTGAQSMKKTRRKRNWIRIWAYSAAAAMAVSAFFLLQPPSDQIRRNAFSAGQTLEATPVPVTVPECGAKLAVSNRTLRAEATFSNHTGDIWLMNWHAEPSGPAELLRVPTGLIWLETGVNFTDQAEWQILSGWEQLPVQAEWSYSGYRVAAELLHWIEGEWLLPGSEGYQEQQMLIEDAFANGALILAPGDWPEGTAGEMQLVLPDSFQKDHPETDALTWYVRSGKLVRELGGQSIIEQE